MTRLNQVPAIEIIRALKGTIDFYVFRGQACARSWPRKFAGPRSQPVQAQWPRFTTTIRAFNLIDASTKGALDEMARTTQRSNRDYFVGLAYLKNLTLNGPPDPYLFP